MGMKQEGNSCKQKAASVLPVDQCIHCIKQNCHGDRLLHCCNGKGVCSQEQIQCYLQKKAPMMTGRIFVMIGPPFMESFALFFDMQTQCCTQGNTQQRKQFIGCILPNALTCQDRLGGIVDIDDEPTLQRKRRIQRY